MRKHSAIGVAEHADRGTCLRGSLEQSHPVIGIVLVAVEEVLHVDEHASTLADQVGHGVGDHVDVLVE